MSVQISSVIRPPLRRHGPDFSVSSIGLHERGHATSPIAMVDDFRVSGRPFEPHPHAGFSAVTYVLRDSTGGLRSRDSLGHDVVAGPGGIVWTHAGRGVLHHETLAQPGRELHGLQFFVNLSARNKLTNPRLLWLDGTDVPDWRNDAGDCVRVVVGAFGGVSSPLAPAEPFVLLDADVAQGFSLDVAAGQFGVVYVTAGEVLLTTDGARVTLGAQQAATLSGSGGRLSFAAHQPAQLVYLSGAEIHEPLVAQGPFIMNDAGQIRDAMLRYQRGEMGELR